MATNAVKRGYRKMHETIIQLLGGKCANPFGLDHGDFLGDQRCLQIDHIHGGGNKEHKIYNGTWALYRHILREIKLGSKDYQLLCANCNWIKRHGNEEERGS